MEESEKAEPTEETFNPMSQLARRVSLTVFRSSLWKPDRGCGEALEAGPFLTPSSLLPGSGGWGERLADNVISV